MNKAELIDALAGEANLPKAEATRAVDALFGEHGIVAKALKAGEKVQITGFGTFQAKQRAARTGRNPATGGTITIPAQVTPTFKAGQGLKDSLNP
ncbi:MAG TPA: HU family DNA-binding protein [Gemmatimonadales bacterium]|nr:HU family DNA-binding protein [Gemmatimonadales bacterium]